MDSMAARQRIAKLQEVLDELYPEVASQLCYKWGEHLEATLSVDSRAEPTLQVVVQSSGGVINSVATNRPDTVVTLIDYDDYPKADHEKIAKATGAVHAHNLLGPDDHDAVDDGCPEDSAGLPDDDEP